MLSEVDGTGRILWSGGQGIGHLADLLRDALRGPDAGVEIEVFNDTEGKLEVRKVLPDPLESRDLAEDPGFEETPPVWDRHKDL